MASVLTWFIRIWIGLVLAANAFGVFAIFAANGFWGGVAEIQSAYSPFNIANIILQVVLLSPALLANWWLLRLRQKQITSRSASAARDR